MPDLPTVSILIAARNEEAYILNCLLALDQLDYPKTQVEILIGNDQSTDQTGPLIARYLTDKPHIRLYEIQQQWGHLRGKSNVLAQLAQQATGQFLLFTDADVEVPPTWVNELLNQFTPTIGIVSGSTTVQGADLFARLQAVDWLLAFTLVNQAANWAIPVTAAGNNMAVRREAYRQVGGYEHLPFSVVEDYALFWAIVQAGWQFSHLLNNRSVALTQPVRSLSAYFQQRKRWMSGAFQLPVYMRIAMLSQYLLAPFLYLLTLVSPTLAISLYATKLCIQTGLLTHTLLRLKQYALLPYVLPYELYQVIFGFLSFIYYFLPGPISWKGRQYPV